MLEVEELKIEKIRKVRTATREKHCVATVIKVPTPTALATTHRSTFKSGSEMVYDVDLLH